MTRILIVDDHPLFRAALRLTLARATPCARFVEAGSPAHAFSIVAAHADLDLAMIDLSMPGVTGLSFLGQLRRHSPMLPIIVVSGRSDPAIVREALALGAAGFIPKSASAQILAEGVAAVLRGEVFSPASPRPRAFSDLSAGDARLRERFRELTPQQWRVLRMMAAGRHNKEIADALKVTESTVKGHVSKILRVLQVASRTRAVILATRIIKPEEAAV